MPQTKRSTKATSRSHARESVHETPARSADDISALERDTSETNWQSPYGLDAPPSRDGFSQRWVRTSLGGAPDVRNWSRRMREGWRPRTADSVPEGYTPPTIQHGDYGSVIGVAGLVLCEIPNERLEQIRGIKKARLDRQTDAIERDLLKVEQQGGIPIQRGAKTQVEVHPERRPKPADDDESLLAENPSLETMDDD